MTNEEIARLRALCEKATPGPYKTTRGVGIEHDDIDDWYYLIECSGPSVSTHVLCRQEAMVARRASATDDDAEFIAAARTALPAALDEIERMQAQVLEYAETLAATRREREDKLTRVQELVLENGILRGLLTRVVKYATEDRARTPGVTRLARVVQEARNTLGLDHDAGRR